MAKKTRQASDDALEMFGEELPAVIPDPPVVPDGPVSSAPLTIQDGLSMWFANNAPTGKGDLRTTITLQMLSARENQNEWTIQGHRMDRDAIMNLIIDLVCEGHSFTKLFKVPGFPRARTISNWLEDYPAFERALSQAQKLGSIVWVEEAKDIADGATPKTAFAAKLKSDIRLRLAESYHPKKFGRKVQVEDERDLGRNQEEAQDRMKQILQVHKAKLETIFGIQIILPQNGPVEIVKKSEVIEAAEVKQAVEGGDASLPVL